MAKQQQIIQNKKKCKPKKTRQGNSTNTIYGRKNGKLWRTKGKPTRGQGK